MLSFQFNISSNPLVDREALLAVGVLVPKVYGSVSWGPNILVVSLSNTSKVKLKRLLRNPASTPILAIVMVSHVKFSLMIFGVNAYGGLALFIIHGVSELTF